jgi:hypothetical protein
MTGKYAVDDWSRATRPLTDEEMAQMTDDDKVAWLAHHVPECDPLTAEERGEWLDHVRRCGGVEYTALGNPPNQ